MAPSSSSINWVYDVFPSFSGEDVRITFLSHFLKELDQKLIISFKDNEIKRSRSLDPELKQAIKDSRSSVVIFSNNYASSSWCLNELLEIVRCKEESGQMVIPVFYGLDPSHVRKQTGDFGKIFQETCDNKTFIDSAFVSKSVNIYSRANPDDYNMKLNLQRNFLSKILGKKDIQIDCLGAVSERLKHKKVLIFIDDLDNHMVLDALCNTHLAYLAETASYLICKT